MPAVFKYYYFAPSVHFTFILDTHGPILRSKEYRAKMLQFLHEKLSCKTTNGPTEGSSRCSSVYELS